MAWRTAQWLAVPMADRHRRIIGHQIEQSGASASSCREGGSTDRSTSLTVSFFRIQVWSRWALLLDQKRERGTTWMSADRWIRGSTMLRRLSAGLSLMLLRLLIPAAAYTRVTEMVVDDDQPLADGYHQISGRAFGARDLSQNHRALRILGSMGAEANSEMGGNKRRH
jgi:hypothetical protein